MRSSAARLGKGKRERTEKRCAYEIALGRFSSLQRFVIGEMGERDRELSSLLSADLEIRDN